MCRMVFPYTMQHRGLFADLNARATLHLSSAFFSATSASGSFLVYQRLPLIAF